MPSCVSVDRDESDMKRPTSSVYWSLIWLKAWWTGPFVVLIQNTSSPGQGISADDSMEVIRASWVRQQKYFKPYSGPSYRRYLALLWLWYLFDPAKEAHYSHILSHTSVSSGNETANSSLTRSEPIWWRPSGLTWIAGVILVLIHEIVSPDYDLCWKSCPSGTPFGWATYKLVLRIFTYVGYHG